MDLSIKLSLALLCIGSVLSVIDSARILGLFPTHSKSHLIIHSAVAEALAERGHNVTVVTSHAPIKKNLPYRYLHLDIPPVPKDLISDALKQPQLYNFLINFVTTSLNLANETLHHPVMQKLMQEESFDLVLQGYFFNEFLFGVAAHFKCPLVLSMTLAPYANVNDFVGNPQEFSYVPIVLNTEKPPFGFYQRVKNFIDNTIREWIYRPILRLSQELYYRANFPSNKYPSLGDMMKNVSLVLTAHHFSQYPIRPNVPAVVEIGGIQIKDKPDPLPKDIQSILDDSTQHGAIYFSLGTNIDSDHLNSSKVKTIFEVLSRLPQTVLCKWSDPEFPKESPNIFYKNWLPQDDVLNHPNVKLFITHGGMGGVVEAQYHGVPMVGIPLFSDQHDNVRKFKKSGFGLSLNYETLTEKSVRNAIVEVLTNQTYTNNVRRFSRIFKDRPLTAKQTAVYWVEYVLRHHGAPHMQSPAVHLNYIQRMSWDVFGLFVAIFYAVFKILKMLFLMLKQMYCNRKFKKE